MVPDQTTVLVFGSWHKREIGKRYTGLTDAHMIHHADQPYVVLAEATMEEWMASHKEYSDKPISEAELNYAKRTPYFYKISVD